MQWIVEKKIYVLVGLVVFVGAIFFFVSLEKGNLELESVVDLQEENEISLEELTEPFTSTEPSSIPIKLVVDVKGAVKSPGVYEAIDGERIIDMITKAGGFLDDADQTKVNLSKKVADEMVIYVPKNGEETPLGFESIQTSTSSETSSEPSQKINMNEADSSTLQTLPGIGESKAKAIIEYRQTNGPFKCIEDLMNVSGIGEKTFEKLSSSIAVN